MSKVSGAIYIQPIFQLLKAFLIGKTRVFNGICFILANFFSILLFFQPCFLLIFLKLQFINQPVKVLKIIFFEIERSQRFLVEISEMSQLI